MDIKERLNEFNQGFIKHNKIEFVDTNEEQTILKVKVSDKSLNPYGIVHGGLLFGLADTAMGVLAAMTGRQAVTTTANITYIKPAVGKEIKCIATVIKRGTTMSHLEAKLYNEKDEVVATATSSYYNIK